MAYECSIKYPPVAAASTTPPPAAGTLLDGLFFPSGVSVIPASGYFGSAWACSSSVPDSFSSAGWTVNARKIPQQTFLGASIRSFTMTGGFGDNSSTLSVELVNDEYNVSDGTSWGQGDDIYHSGRFDKFVPIMVGSPVFFKFGPCFATIQEAYKEVFDGLYKVDTGAVPSGLSLGQEVGIIGGGGDGNSEPCTLGASDSDLIDITGGASVSTNISANDRGRSHIVFGGILQSYTQNRGPGGNPTYSVQVVDPREILSNVTLLLNNYAGSVYGQKNVFNIYGFLECNIDEDVSGGRPKNVLTKNVSSEGVITYTGDDTYGGSDSTVVVNSESDEASEDDEENPPSSTTTSTTAPPGFPITGTGFSRRGTQGIPWYRVQQALYALTEYHEDLPESYKKRSFGGKINFRGFNYIVDFGGLPELPKLYYIDFDQITLLELLMEICDITSRELYVTLLPLIDHEAVSSIYQRYGSKTDPDELIAGIIRIDTIDRSKQPEYGAIKRYITNLAQGGNGILVENEDIGYELSNIVTDKFVVGAQEVDMYYFSSNADRDELLVSSGRSGEGDEESITPAGKKWDLEGSLDQQILPYYGMLGNKAVTIPKGYGSYQQILLDTTTLNANGVGAYYVATEMELRCAAVSYEKWVSFLQIYNDTYLESLELDDAEETGATTLTAAPPNSPPISVSNSYGVSVPRSLFDTYASQPMGEDDLPYSPCNPPYGYPLYYKRMTKLGIPEGGLTDIQSKYTTVITDFAALKNTDQKNFRATLNSQYTKLKYVKETSGLSPFEKQYFDALESLLNESTLTPSKITETIALVEDNISNNGQVYAVLSKIQKKNKENAMKVYNFLKNVADECLGKKFLVRLPTVVNTKYSKKISGIPEHTEGPFGFRYRAISGVMSAEQHSPSSSESSPGDTNMMKSFLDSGAYIDSTSNGALKINYNPISETYEANYTPTDLGGFFDFDLLQNIIPSGFREGGFNSQPSGVQQGLIPQDLTNFINENGRISPYVRFDHSQHLSLNDVPADSFTQQAKYGSFMIPDLCYFLDNVNGDEFQRFPNDSQPPETDDIPESVAFVKCSVSEKLYMPPKLEKRSIGVYGNKVKDIGRKTMPQKIYDPETDSYKDSWSYYIAHYVPTPEVGDGPEVLDFKRTFNTTLRSYIVDTDSKNLNTDFVFALITLPSRISPTLDARFRDGPFQNINVERFKHLMTMDTYVHPHFDKPGVLPGPFPKSSIENLPDTDRLKAWSAAKQAIQGLNFGFSKQIDATSPSPVYPNLVALPLMSHDRCYGPWLSSQLDVQSRVFKNIGGRVEVIKDENLAPWNYAGYQLMNEAGKLQAQFSNSLLLFSERGGFSYPGLPSGNSLGQILISGGPLVTSVEISISDAGIQTTYKMDLYTASFGKLQKQKQDQISQISREKQKLKDEKNALIRKGLGKQMSSLNYGDMYNTLKSTNIGNDANNIAKPLTNMVMSVRRYVENRWSSQGGTSQGMPPGLFGTNGSEHQKNQYIVEGSIQDAGQIGAVAQTFLAGSKLSSEYLNSAVVTLSDLYSPATRDAGHANMASKPPAFIASKSQYYINSDDPNDYSDVTNYGE